MSTNIVMLIVLAILMVGAVVIMLYSMKAGHPLSSMQINAWFDGIRSILKPNDDRKGGIDMDPTRKDDGNDETGSGCEEGHEEDGNKE